MPQLREEGDKMEITDAVRTLFEKQQTIDISLADVSDGYHTFDELYRHRAILFSVIVRDHEEAAWKSKRHHDGTMYDGMFIVGVDTPDGQATYHYDIDPYWDMFDCKVLEYAPEWDGHTPDDAIARIAKLGHGKCKLIGSRCSECGVLIGADASMSLRYEGDDLLVARNQDVNFCPNCGRRIER